jgi:hypothetical protein
MQQCARGRSEQGILEAWSWPGHRGCRLVHTLLAVLIHTVCCDVLQISKVQQCAAQIMRMIKKSTMYESDMRNALGNNPDTSKALRL